MKKFLKAQPQPGWVFFNAEEIEKSRQLFSDFQGSGTIDELGFGILYDEVASKLFPWCSTLTTRAKYFQFSVSLVDCALKSLAPLTEIERSDHKLIRQRALNSVGKYRKRLNDLEKYLGYSIYFLDQEAEGLFGRRKIGRWFLNDTGRIFTRFGPILQNDGRYPNRVYRGSMRSLGAFASNVNELQMIENHLIGKDIFSEDWIDHTENMRLQLMELFDKWDHFKLKAEKDNITFFKLKGLILKDIKKINAFTLTPAQSKFLLEKIVFASPYLKDLNKTQMRRLFSNPETELLDLSKSLKSSEYRSLFAYAYHLNRITNPFNDLYMQVVDYPENQFRFKGNWKEIKASLKWINGNNSSKRWNSDYSNLIERWIKSGKSKVNFADSDALIIELTNRADRIVGGRNKTPPHQVQGDRKENGIREEIDFQPSSFRLWNAGRIIKDILDIKHG